MFLLRTTLDGGSCLYGLQPWSKRQELQIEFYCSQRNGFIYSRARAIIKYNLPSHPCSYEHVPWLHIHRSCLVASKNSWGECYIAPSSLMCTHFNCCCNTTTTAFYLGLLIGTLSNILSREWTNLRTGIWWRRIDVDSLLWWGWKRHGCGMPQE